MGSSNGRKRSRSLPEENRAECPFVASLTAATRPEKDRQRGGNKKQKREDGDDDKKNLVQVSPFEPFGRFKTNKTLDSNYSVEPRKRWLDMTKYNSFVLNNHKYKHDGYVYVANETTIERQSSGAPVDGQIEAPAEWVARILEIRAADEHHVYARVFWMYSPDELPHNTLDGKKMVHGRQSYHGRNELIASNHMDVINVVSITMPANVTHWVEKDDDEIRSPLYWRQAFDCRTSELSTIIPICKCGLPANPDLVLVGCTSPKCSKWLHQQCLRDDILAKVYERLGKDKPHVSDKIPKVKIETENGAAPLDTPDVKSEESPPTIDVLGSDTTTAALKDADEKAPSADGVSLALRAPQSDVATPTRPTPETKKGRPKKTPTAKPWEGLFEATLKIDQGPTHWIIEDKRPNITGGDPTWTEKAECIVCGSEID